jgi:hypothetical protein
MPLSPALADLYSTSRRHKKDIFFFLLFLTILLIGLYFRTSGLFRGLGESGFIFHPDEPKQVLALFNFLNGDYVRYYESLFYDGYPYGLNHLDEYILRPLLLFFNSDDPDRYSLYYHARALRLLYGIAVLLITYQITLRLTGKKSTALLAFLLIGIAPLSVTVAHSATGDIGVDLFASFCFLFLLLYVDGKRQVISLFCCGFAIGAAFSAKYNGLLLGMAPVMVLIGHFFYDKKLLKFCTHCCILGLGTLIGALVFTPNLILDFKTTIEHILANFEFIKNYNVPKEILEKTWLEKAFLGIRSNSIYIISSLGYVAVFSCIVGCLHFAKTIFIKKEYLPTDYSRDIFLLSMSLFPILSFFIALSGKYTVQPFHFSYLLVPLVIVSCVLIARAWTSSSSILKCGSLIVAALLVIEFANVSIRENFFWRLEDNGYHAEKFPATLYDREAFYTHRSDPIRSLFLEAPGSSVFRNHRDTAKGPDAFFWKNIDVAPLPQVANPFGKNWIFINGPTFPRNERMVVVHGEGHGKTLQRYLVLPAGENIAALGLQSGSHPVETSISIGKYDVFTQLEAHQQKIVPVQPQSWRTSGFGDTEVYIIPLKVSVPYSSVWVTILKNDREKQLFNLYGGGQNGEVKAPEPIPEKLQNDFFDALSRIRFLDHAPSWRVNQGDRIPMWEVAIPAGRYRLICDIDGIDNFSEIAIELEDAKGGMSGGAQQSFQINKGLQRIEYAFTKSFAPFQAKVIIHGLEGKSQMLSFKLIPDYHFLSEEFATWRKTGFVPAWISRFQD